MSTRGYPQTRRGLLSVPGLTAALVGAALSMLSPRVAAAQAFPHHCAGTYLIQMTPGPAGHGAQHLWDPDEGWCAPRHQLDPARLPFQRRAGRVGAGWRSGRQGGVAQFLV